MAAENSKERPAALIEASARFQVAFFSPDVFFVDFKKIMISGMHLGKVRPVAHGETFARFQVGFLSTC